jgi:hypothetical protein
LVVCILVFTVFCIFCTVFLYCLFYVHLFLLVCFLLGSSPASEFYMPTFRNTAYEDETECSETSGNYPEESIQHTEHGESLKSRNILICLFALVSTTTATE